MSILVRISPLLRSLANCQELHTVSSGSPLDCLLDIAGNHPALRKWTHDKEGGLLRQVQFYVNGQKMEAEELERPLKDGDEVFILLGISGG